MFEHAKISGTVNDLEVGAGLSDMLSNEKAAFEATLQGIPSQQRLFLRALAKEPTPHPFAKEYSRAHNLGSLSATQNAVKQLSQMDLIKQDTEQNWRVVDPVFRLWLTVGVEKPFGK